MYNETNIHSIGMIYSYTVCMCFHIHDCKMCCFNTCMHIASYVYSAFSELWHAVDCVC